MKPVTPPVVICLLLVLSMALAGISTGRAAGLAALEANLTQLVICADGAGPKSIFLSRDGTPVDLPPCSEILCEDCLQAGSDMAPGTPFTHEAPAPATTAQVLPETPLNHPETMMRARSRAPPVVSAFV
jgi:hypothetical protein